MIDNLTETEKKMYELMARLHTNNVPVIFKGALITKLVLADNDSLSVSRATQDMDMNWIGSVPDMDTMRESIETAINKGEKTKRYSVIVRREYGERKSAGFVITDTETGNTITKMDVDVRKYESGYAEYYYGNTIFHGVTPDQIICDKISAISSARVFRRTKDLVDLYALSQCVSTTAEKIGETAHNNGRVFGSFAELMERKDDVKHSYEKLKGVTNKPPFDDVYSHIIKFVEPFAGGVLDKKWEPDSEMWVNDNSCNGQRSGYIWVRPHTRKGRFVKGHWRKHSRK